MAVRPDSWRSPAKPCRHNATFTMSEFPAFTVPREAVFSPFGGTKRASLIHSLKAGCEGRTKEAIRPAELFRVDQF